jgi:hypothetical protein
MKLLGYLGRLRLGGEPHLKCSLRTYQNSAFARPRDIPGQSNLESATLGFALIAFSHTAYFPY